MTNFPKLAQAIEVAQRLQARLEENDKNWKENNQEGIYIGSEDYSDAIGYVADLFNGVAADMLLETYKTADARSLKMVSDEWSKADREYRHAYYRLESDWQLLSGGIDNI